MFSVFKKNKITYKDSDIVAITSGRIIGIEQVKDEVFSQKIMGDGIAFEISDNVIVAPCNGTLSAVFPTGHAFGVTMKNGVELLVHIGINTVENKGMGMKILAKQGTEVHAGDPVIKLDLAVLKKKYDMTTMLIVTDNKDQMISFIKPGMVVKGQIINQKE